MNQMPLQHQPTLRQLLNSEALAEAQIIFGHDLLDRNVVQVVSSLLPLPRAGSLVVTRPDTMSALREPLSIKDLAALILIKSAGSDSISTTAVAPLASGQALASGGGAAVAPLGVDVVLKRVSKLCNEASIPLIVLPSFGEPGQVADDVRMAFLCELKQANARLHTSLIDLLLDEGLEGLAEEISTKLNRPIAVETADFKVLASRNMGATPVNQQRSLSEETDAALKRFITQRRKEGFENISMAPVKVGRRLVLPVCLSETVVGFVTAMVRPNDDLDSIGEYLRAASLAVMVDFGQRRRDGSVFSVTQKSLLKDLLSGRSLSASDQERLERHYGLDLCDGILVFAMQLIGGTLTKIQWPEDQFVTTEVEGTRIYLLPFDSKSGLSWQEELQALINRIRSATEGGADLKLQCGAARIAETVPDLPEAYREARQALIIGSMIQGEREFVVGYGDLGVKRLLYLMIDHPEFDRFYEETLAPLEAYDEEWESELVPSLRIYLEQGANLNSAARALFIHRHTLRYRLEQIAEILKVDIDSQEVLLNLQIAFMIKDMKGGVKGTP
jgi:purine catabolism regulator